MKYEGEHNFFQAHFFSDFSCVQPLLGFIWKEIEGPVSTRYTSV